MPSASRSSVAQISVSVSQFIKLIKSVSSLVQKSHCYSLRFLRKAPTEKRGQISLLLLSSNCTAKIKHVASTGVRPN